LHNVNQLRFLAMGTRKGTQGVPLSETRLNPAVGLAAYIAARLLSESAAESFRFRLHPWFDRWVKGQLREGDHLISSYGYANASFKWVRAHGGKTFLDGGNSHPENFWSILKEEHERWGCNAPPIAPHHYHRSKAMMADVDYVLSPSSFVTRSFLERGFRPEQILRNVYPLDLSSFSPPTKPRPKDRPLTLISTGSLSFRKGTPYLLEAFRLIRQHEPGARLLLTSIAADHITPILKRNRDLPIDFAPGLPHAVLANRLRSADIFALPSLEDGFGRTVTEALACGLPVIVTPNTGASDLVRPGENGEIVPIRNSARIADAVLHWWEKIRARQSETVKFDPTRLSFARFEQDFTAQLRAINLLH